MAYTLCLKKSINFTFDRNFALDVSVKCFFSQSLSLARFQTITLFFPKSIIIIRPRIKFRYRALVGSNQLPAPIVNGEGDSLFKKPDFPLLRAGDLDLGSGHTAYRHASLIDLYLPAKLH